MAVGVTEPAEGILRVARWDHDHAVKLLAAHKNMCHGCEDCTRLEAHVERTRQQVELLEPEPAEDVPLW